MSKLYNHTQELIIADKVKIADNSITRMIGLLKRSDFLSGEALIIVPCNSIHTWFMRFAIDVIYINKDYKVLKIVRNISPWQMSSCWKAYAVIEFPINQTTHIALGDKLELQL